MDFRRERSVGNESLSRFDVCIIGSGSGGSAAAEVLARAGQKVLMLEAGPNYVMGIASSNMGEVQTAYTNDELKFIQRRLIETDPLTEPRSFRSSEADGVRTHVGDVNLLPKTVGGAAMHADVTTPRFQPFDFELGSRLRGRWPGTSFADWPIHYDELEPFYLHVERTLGVQGEGSDANPYEPPRSGPFPMPPGARKPADERIGRACETLGLHAYMTPHAIASRVYDGRPNCMDCTFCGDFGCPTHARGGPAVTTLRKALLSGNVLLLAETRVVKLHLDPAGREVAEIEAIGPDGARVRYRADRYVLAASPIEDARLLHLSGNGEPIGNSSGQVGRNLMFHMRSYAVGICDESLMSFRGKPPMMGFADFRGDPDDPGRPLGGIVVTGGTGQIIREALIYAKHFRLRGSWLARWLRESPMRDRLLSLGLYAEDAPQPTKRVDLDPELVDVDGLPVARITYRYHDFELSARAHYLPKMIRVIEAAGGRYGIVSPPDVPPTSRHIMGTLRFGTDAGTSVCNRSGRFHDIGNLYAADGALFPTSSGYNPILTISAVGAWVGASMLDEERPASTLPTASGVFMSG